MSKEPCPTDSAIDQTSTEADQPKETVYTLQESDFSDTDWQEFGCFMTSAIHEYGSTRPHAKKWVATSSRHLMETIPLSAAEKKPIQNLMDNWMQGSEAEVFLKHFDLPQSTAASSTTEPPPSSSAPPRPSEVEIIRLKKREFLRFWLAASLREGCYDARDRVLLRRLCSQLHVDWKVLEEMEDRLAREIILAAAQQAEISPEKKSSKSSGRWWKIGLAAVGGGVAMILTAGLATPAVVAVLGFVGATAATTAALTSSAVIYGLFGTSGAGLAAFKMNNRTKALSEFMFVRVSPEEDSSAQPPSSRDKPIVQDLDDAISDFGIVTPPPPLPSSSSSPQPTPSPRAPPSDRTISKPTTTPSSAEDIAQLLTQERAMTCVITVPGYIDDVDDDFKEATEIARVVGHGEHYRLQWESEYLAMLGDGFKKYMGAEFAKSIGWQAAKETTLRVALSALTLPALVVSACNTIDSPWTMALLRAQKAGFLLAEVLCSKLTGARPVTLIGFSLGARVIYYCLLKLNEMKQFHLVENAVLMGSPVTASESEWEKVSSAVAGRVYNCYAAGDIVLAYLYRASDLSLHVAGLEPVCPSKVTNVDVSDLVSNRHLEYKANLIPILDRAGAGNIQIVV